MARRSDQPATGTLTTIMLKTDVHQAVRQLSRVLNVSMKDFIGAAVEARLRVFSDNMDA